jgi:hypothetical protein
MKYTPRSFRNDFEVDIIPKVNILTPSVPELILTSWECQTRDLQIKSICSTTKARSALENIHQFHYLPSWYHIGLLWSCNWVCWMVLDCGWSNGLVGYLSCHGPGYHQTSLEAPRVRQDAGVNRKGDANPVHLPRLGSLLCTWIRAGHLGSRVGQPGSGARLLQLGERVGRWLWVQLLLPALSWKRPFLMACYHNNVVRSCGRH